MRNALCVFGVGVLFATAARAHEYPIAIGSASDEQGDVVALLTTRGFFVRESASDVFRLQCLEYSQMLSTDTPAFVVSGGRLYVSTVEGVVSYALDGCDRRIVDALAGIATLDVTHGEDGVFRVVTSQAGFANDVYESVDGETWVPRGLTFEGGFLTRFRSFGDSWISSGIRVDLSLGQAVHFVRVYAADGSFSERVIDVDSETFRVVILDAVADGSQALVLVDRYAESSEPDEVYRFADNELSLVAERFVVADARIVDDHVYVAHAAGLDRITGGAATRLLDGVRVSGLSSAAGRVFVSTEYAIDQFALGEVLGDEVVALLWYDDVAGPVECADAPEVCAADWTDWLEEIPGDDAELPPDPDAGDADSEDSAGGAADTDGSSADSPGRGAGCGVAAPSASLWALLLGLLVAYRRNTTQRSLLRAHRRESTV